MELLGLVSNGMEVLGSVSDGMEALGLVSDGMEISMPSQKLHSCIAEFSKKSKILGSINFSSDRLIVFVIFFSG